MTSAGAALKAPKGPAAALATEGGVLGFPRLDGF